MSLREALANNPIVAIVAVIIVLGMVGMRFLGGGDSQAPAFGSVYFYDPASGEMILMPNGTRPPIKTEDGREAVRAHVYSCGQCTPEEWFFYIETLSEEAKAKLDGLGEDDDPTEALKAEKEDRKVAEAPAEAGAEPNWILTSSREGEQLANSYMNKERCGSTMPKVCRP